MVFQANGLAFALWGRDSFAADSAVSDTGDWGGYSEVFIDPDGHPWEVAHNPRRPITPDGRTLLHDPCTPSLIGCARNAAR